MRGCGSAMRRCTVGVVGSRYYAIAATTGNVKSDKSYTLEVGDWKLHKLSEGPVSTVTTTAGEMKHLYREMQIIRRMEVASDQLYKQRAIRGFLHLYNGQEAVCVGMEAATSKKDHVITAYRDHGFQYVREGRCTSSRARSVERIISELMGKATGVSAGKGGSMHFYDAANRFWGGNGIVGAQVPVGAGLAFAAQYLKEPCVSISFYGDGAANQGQIFEAYNMAKLWNLPAIFVCENNHYGMGTASNRAAASIDFYTRGDYVPGIRANGMDVLATKETFRFAREYVATKGPLVLEFETYRYVGHSMSDPGISYRTKEEIQKVRETRDPISMQRNRMLKLGIATEDEIDEIDTDVKNQIEAAVKFAQEAPFPEIKELYRHVYSYEKDFPIRGRSIDEGYNGQ